MIYFFNDIKIFVYFTFEIYPENEIIGICYDEKNI